MPTNSLHPDPEFTLDRASSETDERASERPRPQQRASGRKIAVLAACALAVGIGAAYFFWPRTAPVSQQAGSPLPTSAPSPQTKSEPAISYPVGQIEVPPETETSRLQSPLPALDDSDTAAKDTIEAILNGETFIRLLAPNGVIRRIVATIDNLPRRTIAPQILPTVPVPGSFATVNTDRGISIAANNAGRYTMYTKAAESIDAKRLVKFYVRLYPLFQRAYVELGYPDGYFNDRLIAVIDHLLSAPEPQPPIYLSQPKIRFEFTDPALEDLSAGQKILVRVGIDNETRLKAKLREVRRALTGKAAGH